jgi:hypothetical protein
MLQPKKLFQGIMFMIFTQAIACSNLGHENGCPAINVV